MLEDDFDEALQKLGHHETLERVFGTRQFTIKMKDVKEIERSMLP